MSEIPPPPPGTSGRHRSDAPPGWIITALIAVAVLIFGGVALWALGGGTETDPGIPQAATTGTGVVPDPGSEPTVAATSSLSAATVPTTAGAQPTVTAPVATPVAAGSSSSAAGSGTAIFTARLTVTSKKGGYLASVVITNTGTGPSGGWQLRITLRPGDKLLSSSNAQVSGAGRSYLFTAKPGTKIAAGGSTTVGFEVTSNKSSQPESCTIDGKPCS